MVIENGQQVARKVEIGLSGDEYCEVKSGLKEGDVVVIPDDETSQNKSQNRGPGGPPPM